MNKIDLFSYGIAVGMILISSIIFTMSLFIKIVPDKLGGLVLSFVGIMFILFLISIQLEGGKWNKWNKKH